MTTQRIENGCVMALLRENAFQCKFEWAFQRRKDKKQISPLDIKKEKIRL